MSIAVGPLGRNGEASGSLNTSGKVAAMSDNYVLWLLVKYADFHHRFSYSKTKGLFGGVSLEGSAIVERQDANAVAYNSDVTVKRLLSGGIDIPSWAQPLISTIESCTGLPGNRKWINDHKDLSGSGSGYAFGSGLASPGAATPSSLSKKKKGGQSPFPPTSWGEAKEGGSYFNDNSSRNDQSPFEDSKGRSTTSAFETQFQSDFVPEDELPPASKAHTRMKSAPISRPAENIMDSEMVWNSPAAPIHTKAASVSSPFDAQRSPMTRSFSQSSAHSKPYITPKPELTRPLNEGVARAIALYDFNAVEVVNLGFTQANTSLSFMSERRFIIFERRHHYYPAEE
jgi:SH3 domain-containing YSC84-like protein 1